MDLSNRSLTLLFIVTIVLAGLAVALTLNSQQTPTSDATPRKPADLLVVKPIIDSSGGVPLNVSGPVVVEVPEKTPARSATLICEMFKTERPIKDGKTEFPKVPDDGSCQIRLQGTQRAHMPVFPGDALQCQVKGPDTRCSGGAAENQGGQVVVRTDTPATLSLDRQEVGALPLAEPLLMKIGVRHLELTLEDGTRVQWRIPVNPSESIDVFFPIRKHRPDLTEVSMPKVAPAPKPEEGAAAEAG